MRPHPAVRIARVTVPTALVRRLAGMAGTVPPGDELRVTYAEGAGLKPATIRVHRAVCRRYPLRPVGTSRNGSPSAKSLRVCEIIHRQPLAAKFRWRRPTSDRCSPTASQMNHVHICSTVTAAPS